MTDATIKRHAKQASAIQDFSQIGEVGGMIKVEALCITAFKGQEKEYKVSAFVDSIEESETALTKAMLTSAFEIIKYQFKA